jgi:hypothetical protein
MPEDIDVADLLRRVEAVEKGNAPDAATYVDANGQRHSRDRHGLPPREVTRSTVLPPRPLSDPASFDGRWRVKNEARIERERLEHEAEEARIEREREEERVAAEETERHRAEMWEQTREERERSMEEFERIDCEVRKLRAELDDLVDRRSELLGAINRWAPS